MKGLMFTISYALWVCTMLVTAATFSNPLKNPNGSDPFLIYVDDFYYLVTTTWTNLQITRAQTLEGLKRGEMKTIWGGPGKDVWAPELHQINGTWYCYHSQDRKPYVAKGGASPWDAYSTPVRITSTWGIDGTILNMPGWGSYFVFSCLPSNIQSLCIAPLTSPTTIGPITTLSQPTNSWEKVGFGVNEGPAALHHGNRTWLAYSASYCGTASYAIALLAYDGQGDPIKPASWTKSSGPVFSSANGNYGTAHNSFFLSPDGTETWNIYHVTMNSAGSCSTDRQTFAQILNWKPDGTPDFGIPVQRGKVMEGPSGE